MVKKSHQKMYKTIRHGENSLQYTILPQTDDLRCETKLKSTSRAKKTHSRKPKRCSFFAYLGVIFICTVIIGAVLIPFILSGQNLANPKEWFQKTKLALSRFSGIATNQTTLISNKKTDSQSNRKTSIIEQQYLKTNVGKSVKIIKKDGIERIVLKFNKTEPPTDVTPNAIETLKVENPLWATAATRVWNLKTELETTSLATTAKNTSESNTLYSASSNYGITNSNGVIMMTNSATNISKDIPLSFLTNNNTNSLINKARILSTVKPYMSTRHIQAPLLKSTDKKSNSLPIHIRYLTTQGTSVDIHRQMSLSTMAIELEKNEKNTSWIVDHWPYIDPSSYFQWNRYKAEDGVLLPAILCFTMIALILIIIICLIARNKQKSIAGRQLKRSDVEASEECEDNATLLANTYLSDED